MSPQPCTNQSRHPILALLRSLATTDRRTWLHSIRAHLEGVVCAQRRSRELAESKGARCGPEEMQPVPSIEGVPAFRHKPN